MSESAQFEHIQEPKDVWRQVSVDEDDPRIFEYYVDGERVARIHHEKDGGSIVFMESGPITEDGLDEAFVDGDAVERLRQAREFVESVVSQDDGEALDSEAEYRKVNSFPPVPTDIDEGTMR